MPNEPKDDLAVLRAEMGARLSAVEKWLERVTAAIEKLSDNRERLVILEVQFKAELEHIQQDIKGLKSDFIELKQAVRAIAQENGRQTVSIAKLDMVKAGILVVTTALLTGAIGVLTKVLFG